MKICQPQGANRGDLQYLLQAQISGVIQGLPEELQISQQHYLNAALLGILKIPANLRGSVGFRANNTRARPFLKNRKAPKRKFLVKP